MKKRVVQYLFIFLSVSLITIGFNGRPAETFGADKAGGQSAGDNEDTEFKLVKRGVYDKNEQKVRDMIREYLTGTPEELAARIKTAKAGEKQVGNMELNSGLEPLEDYTPGDTDLLTAAYKLNPDNPLYTDKAYAKKTKWGALIAAPLAINIGVAFPYLPKLSDAWLWGRTQSVKTMGGLDHELTFYKPIYAGDTLHSEITRQDFIDMTVGEESPVRTYRVIGEGYMYNQKGEKVMHIYHSGVENLSIFKDASIAATYDTPTLSNRNTKKDDNKGSSGSSQQQMRMGRTIHKYTDADWEYIKELWSKEEIRGANPLYWEDVNIGDEPAWTCDGPVTEEDRWSGGVSGAQKSTTVRDVLTGNVGSSGAPGGPPGAANVELTRDEYGMYHVESGQTSGMPGAPGGAPTAGSDSGTQSPNRPSDVVISGSSVKPVASANAQNVNSSTYTPSSFMNTQGRDFAARFITNWMGDDGWLYKFCWRLGGGAQAFPAEYDRPSYLFKVPYLKEQGKYMNIHGMVTDLGITKGYVCDKYVKDGKYYVDLVVWCENIEGDIWQEMYAIVELPSKSNKGK